MRKLLAALLIFLGVGVIGFWSVFILAGEMTQGLKTVDSNSYIILHQLAELTMAGLAILGGWLLWQNHSRGKLVGGIALGSLLYSGINSLGWGLLNDAALAVLFVFVILVSAWGIFYLWTESP